MKEAFLLILLIALFISGYFVMKKIDIFTSENLSEQDDADEKAEPSYIVLTNELTDEEIAKEIRRFKEKHGKTDIVICNSNHEDTDKENL